MTWSEDRETPPRSSTFAAEGSRWCAWSARARGGDALEITPGGQINGAGGGDTAGGVEQLAPIDATALTEAQVGSIGGGSLKVQGWSVIGRAGPGIASVEIEPAGAPAVLATLENGWFAGWWPANIPPDRLGDPALAPDVVVRGYDAAGTLLAEVRP